MTSSRLTPAVTSGVHLTLLSCPLSLAPAPTSSITVSPKFQVLTDTSAGLGLDDTYSVVIVKQGAFWVSGKVDDQKFEYELTSPDNNGKHKLSGVLIEGLGFKRLGGDTPQTKFNLFARFTHHTGEERKICISSGATSTWTLGCLRGLIGLVDNDSLLDPFVSLAHQARKQVSIFARYISMPSRLFVSG